MLKQNDLIKMQFMGMDLVRIGLVINILSWTKVEVVKKML